MPNYPECFLSDFSFLILSDMGNKSSNYYWINFDYWNNQWNSYWNSYNNQTNKQDVDPNKEIKTHFSVLKIPYTKDIKIIKQQYRKLCFKYHPDCGGDKEQFIKIQESYEYIINHI